MAQVVGSEVVRSKKEGDAHKPRSSTLVTVPTLPKPVSRQSPPLESRSAATSRHLTNPRSAANHPYPNSLDLLLEMAYPTGNARLRLNLPDLVPPSLGMMLNFVILFGFLWFLLRKILAGKIQFCSSSLFMLCYFILFVINVAEY